MEIAAYPVPYLIPSLPRRVDVRPTVEPETNLSSGKRDAGVPGEKILQGEVLGQGTSRKPDSSTYEDAIFERQQQNKSRPDLSSLSPDSRRAIQSYLDNELLSTLSFNTRPLIDEYV